jgi:hypothetical protein
VALVQTSQFDEQAAQALLETKYEVAQVKQ